MRKARSARLMEALAPYSRIVVVAHDFPDPDAIAAGWAMHWMLRKMLGREVRFVGGGNIIRAENRWMVELLKPPLELVSKLENLEDTGTVLVDCSPRAENHLLARAGALPTAHIDHHAGVAPEKLVRFRDVRPRAAATASIVAGYLREQQLEPGALLATAMLYALRTETQGNETHFTRSDRAVLSWLTERADPSKLAQIENAPLPRAYFSDLVLALQNTFLYEDAAFCLLPRAEGPETVAQVADLLVRADNVERVLCGARMGNDLFLSIRTGPEAGSASDLVRQVVAGIGDGGGHEHRAGGQIRNVVQEGHPAGEVLEKLRHRWLAACGIEQQRGTRLVAKREIISNL